MTIRLYLDEDSMDKALVQALRARSVDVTTALEAGSNEMTRNTSTSPRHRSVCFTASTSGISIDCMRTIVQKPNPMLGLSWLDNSNIL